MRKKWLSFLILALMLGTGLFSYVRYRMDYVFIDKTAYPRDSQFLDLRDEDVSAQDVARLQQQLPGCRILWSIPFQGAGVSSDVQEIALTRLTVEEAEFLSANFPNLTTVQALGCQDYDALEHLQALRPDLDIRLSVQLCGSSYDPRTTTALSLESPDEKALSEALPQLPQLQSLHISKPTLPAEALWALIEENPQIQFTWDTTVLGKSYPWDATLIDLSNTPLDSIDALEQELQYFPKLDTLILSHCGIDSETLAAYRGRVRDQYKVVWSVLLGKEWTRTDVTTYVPVREGHTVEDADLRELKYCEDLIAVDLGHMTTLSDFDWINYTPHLQFLVLVETQLSDLTPIGKLKELKYLEIFLCKNVTDYSPLIGCTSLRDLNVAKTRGDIKFFAQMPWLKCLYANACKAPQEDRQFLRENLPNTLLELDSPAHLARGWRDRDLYYTMRDLFGMKYLPTNAVHYKERMAGTYGGND